MFAQLTFGGGTSLPLNNLDLLKQAGSWLVGPIPGVVVNFLKTDADAQVIAKPQLRVSEGAKATVRIGEGRPPSPTPTAGFGDPGFHIAHVMCDGCDWVALAEGCPLCGGPGPLRSRPG